MGKLRTDLAALRTDLENATTAALNLAALDAKKRYELVARRASGGDGVLSGVGKRGRKIGVKYDFTKGSRGQTVEVYATGPWQLVEYQRRGGYRIPKRRGTGPNRQPSRRNAPRLNMGGMWRTGPFTGAALRGRPYWAQNTPAILAEQGDAMIKAWVTVLDRGW